MKNRCRRLIVIGSMVILGACGQKTADSPPKTAVEPVLTAATLGQQTFPGVSQYQAQPQYLGADIENGSDQAQICKACHSLNAGGPNMIGPGLHGFFGRGAGEQEGFRYSSALSDADFIWTPRALDAWLKQPSRFLPGNSMAFAGVMKQQDRDDLIAYLLKTTSSNSDGD